MPINECATEAPEAPKTQISEQIDIQDSLSEELLSSLKELEEKLSDVLSTWCENWESGGKENNICILADKLRFTNDRLKNWINLIQEIKRRIELYLILHLNIIQYSV